MEIVTNKEVTHEITMSQEQLNVLVDVLENYKREIVDRMPEGYAATTDFSNMLFQFRNALDAGWR
jgi:hypothetical protein